MDVRLKLLAVQCTVHINAKVLSASAVVFVAFPIFLFVCFWIRFPFNLLLFLTIGVVLWLMCRSLSHHHAKTVKMSYRQIVLLIILAGILAVISGAGGFVLQRGDWTKHNVILNDLIHYPWPVYYGASAYVADTTLVYYLGYYLPAALIGKLLGWRGAELVLGAYTFVGAFLFVLLLRVRQSFTVRSVLLFFLLSGLDIVGNLILTRGPIDISHLETYAYGLQLPSPISQITWVPQHTISAWLFTILISYALDNDLWRYVPFLIVLSLLWSPFVTAGLAIMYVPLYLMKFTRSPDIHALWMAIAGMPLMAVILVYYQSRIPILNDSLSLYWLNYASIGSSRLVTHMVVLTLLELLIFVPLLWYRARESRRETLIGVWIIVVLFGISMFTYGTANDWMMRASMPALTLLGMILVPRLETIVRRGGVFAILILAVFLLGAVTPITQIIVLKDVSNPATNEQPDRDMRFAHEKYGVIHQQYMGSASRSFGRLFGAYPRRAP